MSAHSWTREDFDFAKRVDAELRRCASSQREMFGACANQWGPRSAPALGCLVAAVREAWGDPTFMPGGETVDGWRFDTGSEHGDLLHAMEAALT